MPKKVKYYGIWNPTFEDWTSWKWYNWALPPDLYIVNGTIGVWLNKEALRVEINHRKFWRWEVKEFTPLDALKERMRR